MTLKVPEQLAQALVNELVKAYPAIALVDRLRNCEVVEEPSQETTTEDVQSDTVA